jgi:hypothetical protein
VRCAPADEEPRNGRKEPLFGPALRGLPRRGCGAHQDAQLGLVMPQLLRVVPVG